MSSSAKAKQAEKQYDNQMAAMRLQRQWDLEDRAEARAYNEAHPTVVRSQVDYEKLVKAARKAGFNPLTALRNGGAGGFAVSSSPGTYAPLSRQAPVKQATAGAGAFIGESLQQAGNSWLTNFDPFSDRARESSYQLAQAQIRNLNASTDRLRSQSFNVPAYAASNKVRPSRSKAGSLSSVMLDGYRYRGAGKNGEIEDLWNVYRQPDGSYIRLPNPNIADSEQFATVPLASAENVITRPILSKVSKDGGWMNLVKVTPVPEGERGNEGTLWDYWPAIEFQW